VHARMRKVSQPELTGRTMAPPVRPPGLRGAPRKLRSRATCEIALLPHHHASLVPPSTNNCAFGQDFREAARANTGCPRSNSHWKVTKRFGENVIVTQTRVGIPLGHQVGWAAVEELLAKHALPSNSETLGDGPPPQLSFLAEMLAVAVVTQRALLSKPTVEGHRDGGGA
jgi:hypothetical protein